jgi:N-acetylglucosaminyl-diphospho-decaprenol L-rhamnosyltransferase
MSVESVTGVDVSVIVVSYNTRHMLQEMFASLDTAARGLNLQIIVVDNASVDGSVEFLGKNYPDITLIENKQNVGFGRANNMALPLVRGKYVLLLNTDAFVSPDTLKKTAEYMDANPECGVLGVKLLGRNQELQPSCRYFPTPWNIFLKSTGFGKFFKNVQLVDDMQWDHASVKQCDWVPGCYYLVRREVIEQVGLFDPRYFLYYEEVDHCLSAKNAGWEVHYYPHTSVIHIGGESAKSEGELTSAGSQIEEIQIESELLYFRKNHGLLAVMMRVFLAIVADIICAFKRLVKKKRLMGMLFYLKHSWLVCILFVRTRLGTQPTR